MTVVIILQAFKDLDALIEKVMKLLILAVRMTLFSVVYKATNIFIIIWFIS